MAMENRDDPSWISIKHISEFWRLPTAIISSYLGIGYIFLNGWYPKFDNQTMEGIDHKAGLIRLDGYYKISEFFRDHNRPHAWFSALVNTSNLPASKNKTLVVVPMPFTEKILWDVFHPRADVVRKSKELGIEWTDIPFPKQSATSSTVDTYSHKTEALIAENSQLRNENQRLKLLNSNTASKQFRNKQLKIARALALLNVYPLDDIPTSDQLKELLKLLGAESDGFTVAETTLRTHLTSPD